MNYALKIPEYGKNFENCNHVRYVYFAPNSF